MQTIIGSGIHPVHSNNCFSTKFSGSYSFLKYILKKYNLYDGEITKLLKEYSFSVVCSTKWKSYYGVPLRLWNMLNKDLMILKFQGIIEFESLETLKREYEENKGEIIQYELFKHKV